MCSAVASASQTFACVLVPGRAADDTGAYAAQDEASGVALDVDTLRVLRDAQLGSGSVRLARPITAEVTTKGETGRAKR